MAEPFGNEQETVIAADDNTAALCARVQAGDPGAEEDIISYLQWRVRAFLHVRTADRRLVEEVSQEVMMAVICALREGRVREPGNLRSYAYGIARNRLYDNIRKRSREKLEPSSGNREFAAPTADAEATRRFQTALREIEKLFGTDREILSMTLMEGLKSSEIALALSLSCDVVRQRKSRAVKKIADRLSSTAIVPGSGNCGTSGRNSRRS